jgi:hypothetical protein
MALLARCKAMPSKASRRARTARGQRRTLSTIRLTEEAEEDDECAGAAAAVAVVAVAAPVVDDKVAAPAVPVAADDDEADDDDDAVSDDRDPTVSCATASACPTRYCCTYRLSNVTPECSMLCTDASPTGAVVTGAAVTDAPAGVAATDVVLTTVSMSCGAVWGGSEGLAEVSGSRSDSLAG